MNASPWKDFLRSCWKNANFMIGFVMLMSIVVLAIFADQIAPYEYDGNNPIVKMQAPSAEHLLGTDNLGRDLFSRIVYGTRITLKVALLGGSIQLALGVVIGLLCGYYGGALERGMLFLADLTWCVPGMNGQAHGDVVNVDWRKRPADGPVPLRGEANVAHGHVQPAALRHGGDGAVLQCQGHAVQHARLAEEAGQVKGEFRILRQRPPGARAEYGLVIVESKRHLGNDLAVMQP